MSVCPLVPYLNRFLCFSARGDDGPFGDNGRICIPAWSWQALTRMLDVMGMIGGYAIQGRVGIHTSIHGTSIHHPHHQLIRLSPPLPPPVSLHPFAVAVRSPGILYCFPRGLSPHHACWQRAPLKKAQSKLLEAHSRKLITSHGATLNHFRSSLNHLGCSWNACA